MVVGYADLTDCFEMSLEDLVLHNNKHMANSILEEYAGTRETLFVWVLKNIESEPEPYHYSYSTGSWCKGKK